MKTPSSSALDWSEIRGQIEIKRVLEIATSGYHSLFVVGPPNSARDALATSVQTLLPGVPFIEPETGSELPLALEQAIESKGILFLEDLGTWDDASLALLRRTQEVFAGHFFLVATGQYCPCGNFNDTRQECGCFLVDIAAYQHRLSETVNTFFTLHAHVQSDNPLRRHRDESSHEVQQRIEATHHLQQQRNRGKWNSELSLAEMHSPSALALDETAQRLLQQILLKVPMSPQRLHTLLQVALTSASIAIANPIWTEPVTSVEAGHLAEACCLCVIQQWEKRVYNDVSEEGAL